MNIQYNIALLLDSLLLRGVSAGPCFCLWARCRKHARRHARPRDGLKAGPALTPRNNRLSSGRAMQYNKFFGELLTPPKNFLKLWADFIGCQNCNLAW